MSPRPRAGFWKRPGTRTGTATACARAYGVSGVEDGTPLRVRWTILDREEMGEAIQAQWRAIGIDVAIEIVPGPVQLEMVNNRDFDLMYERQRSPDPLLMDMLWNSAHDVVGGWAWTGFVDEELDGLVGQLRTIPDREARCELAQDAQRIIMENALMFADTQRADLLRGVRRGAGFRADVGGAVLFCA